MLQPQAGAVGYKMLQQHSTPWLPRAVHSSLPLISVAKVRPLSRSPPPSLTNQATFRQRPSSDMGLPRLRDPGIPTNLRRLPLVLGLPIDEPDRQRHSLSQPRHLRPSSDRNRYTHRYLTLGHRRSLISWSPRLLSSSTRTDPEFLQIGHAPQDCALVLRYRSHPELLPIRTIRT